MLAAVYEADADTTSSRQIMMRFCLEAEMRGKEGDSGSIVVTASTNPRLKAAIGSVDVDVVCIGGGSLLSLLLFLRYYLVMGIMCGYNRGEEF